jgi:hypothetical protein
MIAVSFAMLLSFNRFVIYGMLSLAAALEHAGMALSAYIIFHILVFQPTVHRTGPYSSSISSKIRTLNASKFRMLTQV